jgi:neutral trehalase
MNQIDNIMALADEYASSKRWYERDELRAAIEAALGSGEPVAYRQWNSDEGYWYYGDASCAEKDDELLYTAPQPQQWVGLTDEERGQIINANFGTGLWLMAKDIEAKLREKNGGGV